MSPLIAIVHTRLHARIMLWQMEAVEGLALSSKMPDEIVRGISESADGLTAFLESVDGKMSQDWRFNV